MEIVWERRSFVAGVYGSSALVIGLLAWAIIQTYEIEATWLTVTIAALDVAVASALVTLCVLPMDRSVDDPA